MCLLAVFLGFGAVEYAVHRRRRDSIPIRIHVNGTRGKSSVTRLIAAGLRAGGIRTVAKTTGSAAQMIFEDGSEAPVPRIGPPRVAEQMAAIRVAARRRVRAVVLECMAVQPYLQWISERKMIRATLAVITNVRPDHLDVMGPTVDHVALALAGVIPQSGTLVTERSAYDTAFSRIADDMAARPVFVEPGEVEAVSDEEIARFGYLEHKSNVATALAVCRELGVDRATALAGMVQATPDPGALRVCHLEFFGKSVRFANAFAANDPESNAIIWEMLRKHYGHLEPQTHVVVVNSREDRPQRSEQLGELIAGRIPADFYVLVGTDCRTVLQAGLAAGADPARILDLEGESVAEVFEEILHRCGPRALVVGMGNIKGIGTELAWYFENRSVNHD